MLRQVDVTAALDAIIDTAAQSLGVPGGSIPAERLVRGATGRQQEDDATGSARRADGGAAELPERRD